MKLHNFAHFKRKEEYLNYYRLDKHITNYSFEFMEHLNERYFVQKFSVEDSKGTCILIHGYLEHSACFAPLITFLLENKMNVVTYDLHGHGLSSGRRGDIEDFRQYVAFLNQLLETNKKENNLYLFGYSTGAAIVMEYLLSVNIVPIKKVILINPFIKPSLWRVTEPLVTISHKYISKIKRNFTKNTSDVNYLRFVRNDPLQLTHIPLNWLHAAKVWHEKLSFNRQKSSQDILVIQGMKDQTVDWRYNLPFIVNIFPKSDIILMDNGKHQLINEEENMKENVFYLIKQVL
ncbi:MAG: alpha/beta hydrolase [Bacillaceae bacterium]|nr:alpha/beta hydrolase [Bacillaceae bacterium]